MTETTRPFDDIRALISAMPDANDAASDSVRARLSSFTGPQPVLGSWHELMAWYAAWQDRDNPTIMKPLISVFCASHLVAKHFYADEDVVALAQSRVKSLSEGSAAVRGIAGELGAAFKVFEMGLEVPVPDITKEPALSERDCAAAIAFGMEVVAEGADIVVLGNAGLGSATASAAIAYALYGGSVEYWAGGSTDSAKARIEAVKLASQVHKMSFKDPLETLRTLGGRDLSGLVGAIIACRHQRIPVILDGFVVCAAAAVLHAIDPGSIAHCRAGHKTSEPGHQALIERLGLAPVHNYDFALGDGSGAAFALSGLKLAFAGLDSVAPGDV